MRPTTLSALVQNYFKLICYHMFFNKLLSVFELRTVSYSLSFFTMFFSVILWHTLLVPLPSYGEIWQQVLTQRLLNVPHKQAWFVFQHYQQLIAPL